MTKDVVDLALAVNAVNGGFVLCSAEANALVNELERLRATMIRCRDDLKNGLTALCLERLESACGAVEPSALETAASETQALDAAKWRTLMSLPRIRVVGGAGFSRDDPDHYAFLTVELWTKHDAPTTPEARHMFDKFMAIAEKAQVPLKNTSEDLPSQAAVIHDNGDAYK